MNKNNWDNFLQFSIKTYVVGFNLMHLGEAKTCNEYSFEDPWWGSSNEYPQLMFLWREKIQSSNTYPEQFLCMFYFQNRIWHFMNIVSNEDYLHEVSNPIFWINNNHFIACWISPESDKC